MNAHHPNSASPALPFTLRRLRCAAVVLAALGCGTAGAETYTVTTRTTGDAGSFNLRNLFPQGDLLGTHAYELSVTSVFDSANVVPDGGNHFMQASNARLHVSITLDGLKYSLDTTGTVRSQLLFDTDGNGNTTKRFYQSVSFDPATYGDEASIQQYVFVGADQLIIDSVLQPASAYFADPLTKGFSIYDWDVPAQGPLVQLGDAGGRAGEFHYQLSMVPEPATYAMFGAGLGLVAFARRRRTNPA